MSETEYSRLAEKLDELTKVVYKMDERLKDLPELTSKVATHETEILMNKQSIKSCKERCDSVQKEKEKKDVPWGKCQVRSHCRNCCRRCYARYKHIHHISNSRRKVK